MCHFSRIVMTSLAYLCSDFPHRGFIEPCVCAYARTHTTADIEHRDCDVSCDCNHPVSQLQRSILTCQPISALCSGAYEQQRTFHILIVKMKQFEVLCCNELNIKDYIIGISILKNCFVSIL